MRIIKRKALAGGMLSFVVLVAMFFVGFWYVYNTQGFDASINATLESNATFSQDDYWLNNSSAVSWSSDCFSENETLLLVDGGETCSWRSIKYDTSGMVEGIPLQYDYVSNYSSGSASASVASYINGSVEESYTYELGGDSGSVDLSQNFSTEEVDGVDVQIDLSGQVESSNSTVEVLYEDRTSATTVGQISFIAQLQNDGNESIDLTNFKMRYYFTSEPSASDIFKCDYSSVGSCSHVTSSFADTSVGRYVELGWSTGSISPGETARIEARVHPEGYSGSYDQSDDHSWGNYSSLQTFENITAYENGELIWGTTDTGDSATMTAFSDVAIDSYNLTVSEVNRVTKQGLTEQDTYVFMLFVFLATGILMAAKGYQA